MAEPLRDLVAAVATVEQTRRDQMPDLVRADRPDLRGFGQLVGPVGEICWVGSTGPYDGRNMYRDIDLAATGPRPGDAPGLDTEVMTGEGADQSGRDVAVQAVAGAAAAVVGLVVAGPVGALAGAAATPMLERAFGFLDDRLFRRRALYAAETLADAASEAGATSDEKFEEFVEQLVGDEERQELLTRVLSVAQESAMRDKRRALGRVLASAAAETGTKVDQQFALARVIADLDPVHVRILRIMGLTPAHLVGYAVDNGLDPTTVRRWYPWSIVATDPGVAEAVWTALRVLERNDLVWKVGENHTPQGGMEPEYEITGYGDYLLQLLAEPEAEAGSPRPQAADPVQTE